MDALSNLLQAVRLKGGVFLDARFTAPWCVSARIGPEDCRPFLSDPCQVIAYHYVTQGRLQLQIEGISSDIAGDSLSWRLKPGVWFSTK